MSRLRALLVAGLIVATVGCTSTTQGSGTTHVRRSTGPVPGFPTPGAGATAPVAVPPPAECATPSCTLLRAFRLGARFTISVHANTSAGGGAGASILEFTEDGTPAYWRVFAGETPAELACDRSSAVRNCVLVDYVGAHGSIGYPIILVDQGLWVGAPVRTDTPGLHAGDLDGDGLVDAFGVQNDYAPSYAEGKVQWQTWRRSGDGTVFTSTGCGGLSRRLAPAPTTLLTGACAA